MQFRSAILSVIISAGVALLVSLAVPHSQVVVDKPEVSETAFDRVMKTNTLRCGYANATPWFVTDPNTKEHSGVGYDVTNAVAEKIGLKVEWVEETDWGLAEQGVIANRYDMMCGSVCIDPRRARAATYSTPFLNIPILAVVKVADKRFDGGLDALNDPAVRIGVKAGHVFEFIANERFPRAQKVYANSISDDTEFLQMLKFNKVDVAFEGQSTVDSFNEKNPETPVRSLNEPVRFCNGAYMMPLGDMRLKTVIDNAIGELNSSGQIRQILNRYVKDDPRYVRTPTLLYSGR